MRIALASGLQCVKDVEKTSLFSINDARGGEGDAAVLEVEDSRQWSMGLPLPNLGYIPTINLA